ncbi:MAG TPA: tail fiber protein [Rhodocyclaceae bacterium]
MSDCFLGEIRLYAFSFPPRGWALCDGSLLQINQNTALYSLLQTNFGGDGKTTFGLPDLQGRVPRGQGVMTNPPVQVSIGEKAGVETVNLTQDQIPSHTHAVRASTLAGTVPAPTNAVFGKPSTPTSSVSLYAAPGTWQAVNAVTIGSGGGNAGHENMQPFEVINFCIATQGYYPPRN